jgi:D-xylonolactonase
VSTEPLPVADYACHTGEGPLYHPDEDRVYWVDIPHGRLFRMDRQSGEHTMVLEGEPIGGFTLQDDGSLLLFMGRGAIRRLKDGEISTLIDEIPDETETRFNDVIADPEGRVFCGTMSTHHRQGRLYRLDTDGSLHLVLEGIGCSNGMGFTPDRSQMYYTDTTKRHIYLFDYDQATGAITNQRIFVETPEGHGEGYPDGMTVDAEGYVWSTRWDGSKMVRYSPAGEEVGRIEFPARKVSSLTFGGPDYKDVFVTTAGGEQKEADGVHAGALFQFRSEVPGVPEFRSKVQIS